jgi:uncharacterized peroxidase-related enzyme
MAFIETIAVHEATRPVREMYERQQAYYGYVPNYAKVFSHRPEIMRLWAALLSGIKRNVDRRTFELTTVAAALAVRSTYCSLAHGKALTEFFDSDEIQAILSDADPGPLTDAEKAMMRFARRVARDASSITADEVATLKSHGFSDAEVFDIAAVAAARTFFAQLCESLGSAADVSFLELEPSLRELLTVGRPIDGADVERVT